MKPKQTMMKRSFKAALKPSGVLEILVYQEIGYDFWTGEGVTAASVKQAMDDAGDFRSILVRVNSPGGDAFEGVAIYNLLRSLGKPVEVIVDGIAASAASIIAMAGTSITMGTAAMMMIHNAWGFCMGEAADMLKTAALLDKISGTVAEAYIAKTGKDAAEIKAIMDAETWLSAQECVDQGFATAVAAYDDEDAALALAGSFKSLAKMKKVPTSLKAAPRLDDEDDAAGDLCVCPCVPCQSGDCSGCNCADPNCMAKNCNGDGCCGDGDVAQDPNNTSTHEARLRLLRCPKV